LDRKDLQELQELQGQQEQLDPPDLLVLQDPPALQEQQGLLELQALPDHKVLVALLTDIMCMEQLEDLL
jgi:hypothetical protein